MLECKCTEFGHVLSTMSPYFVYPPLPIRKITCQQYDSIFEDINYIIRFFIIESKEIGCIFRFIIRNTRDIWLVGNSIVVRWFICFSFGGVMFIVKCPRIPLSTLLQWKTVCVDILKMRCLTGFWNCFPKFGADINEPHTLPYQIVRTFTLKLFVIYFTDIWYVK